MGMAGDMSENSMASSKPDALWVELLWGVGNMQPYTVISCQLSSWSFGSGVKTFGNLGTDPMSV